MKSKICNICSALNEREIIAAITNLQSYYEKKVEKLENACSILTEYQLKVCRHRTKYQCYLVDRKTGKTKFIKSNDQKCNKIVQAEYNKKQKKEIIRRLKYLNGFLTEIEENPLNSVYSNMSEGRKTLISPVDSDDEVYLKNWIDEKYNAKDFVSDEIIHKSANGLRVRSKSEILIADELDRRGIPYKYERPLTIGDITYHPDFTILNLTNRREVIWEHFGLLDDMNYRDDFIRKIKIYESAGYILGVNFFFTVETGRMPLTRSDIQNTITKIIG